MVLLKAKIEELKTLFTNKSLGELEKLKFSFQEVEEPTLNDIPPLLPNRYNQRNKVELPPKKKIEKVLEKEEN